MGKAVAVSLFGIVLIGAVTAGCAPVGSERWCDDMRETPRGDWTANEALDFAKYCVKF